MPNTFEYCRVAVVVFACPDASLGGIRLNPHAGRVKVNGELRGYGRGTAGHSHRVLPVGLPSMAIHLTVVWKIDVAPWGGSTGAVEQMFLGIVCPCNTTTTTTTTTRFMAQQRTQCASEFVASGLR